MKITITKRVQHTNFRPLGSFRLRKNNIPNSSEFKAAARRVTKYIRTRKRHASTKIVRWIIPRGHITITYDQSNVENWIFSALCSSNRIFYPSWDEWLKQNKNLKQFKAFWIAASQKNRKRRSVYIHFR